MRDPAEFSHPRAVAKKIGRYTLVSVLLGFFALPMLWLASAPFNAHPTLNVSISSFTLHNFSVLLKDPYALPSLWNSLLLAGGTALLTVGFAAAAAYALSRVRVPGRDGILYALLLLSSIVTGTAAMVPLFQLAFKLHLIDSRLGVILVFTGGLIPAAIFILKDFTDNTPKSYEESARVFGASPFQIIRHIVLPLIRPGLATVTVWAVVNVWSSFLIPYILVRTPEKYPASVVLYTFYTEGGQPNLALISAFSLLYSIPVVVLYLFVSHRYGFRFHGGIKR